MLFLKLLIRMFYQWLLSLLLCLFIPKASPLPPEKCYSPVFQEGRCVPILSCPELLPKFANPQAESIEYLEKLICDKRNGIKVCCDVSLFFLDALEENSTISHSEIYLEDLLNCNSVTKFSEEEFDPPPLPEIRVEHLASGKKITKCLGSLITPRYVLTAAECLDQNKDMPEYRIESIRFQVTHKRRKHFRSFDVEEEILHPFFDKVSGINNLALLRINSSIFDKDTIPQTCLYKPQNSFPKSETSAGIIVSSLRGNAKGIMTKLISNQECEQERIAGDPTNVLDVCTAAMKSANKITPIPYAGAPIFAVAEEANTALYLAGVSSSKTDYTNELPSVYTNISLYFDWIFGHVQPWPVNNEQCRTPNGEAGSCVSLIYCPVLLQAFTNPKKGMDENLRKYICDADTNFLNFDVFVCCSPTLNIASFEHLNPPKVESSSLGFDFFDLQHCGIQQKDDYFSNTEKIAIDEFPWTVSILQKHDESDFYSSISSGSLINARYVLTVATQSVDAQHLIVRLGDFNRKNKTDCVEDLETGAADCSDYEDYNIEKSIIHPLYSSWSNVNDIGLLRLGRTVIYTDYIRPICLPKPGIKSAKLGDTLYLSSWGWYKKSHHTVTKKKIENVLIPNAECKKRLRKSYDSKFVSSLAMCTLYSKMNDTLACNFDEGGTLMFHENYQWHIEGILTKIRGHPCNEGNPLVYTKVSNYFDWIVDNMEPWEPTGLELLENMMGVNENDFI